MSEDGAQQPEKIPTGSENSDRQTSLLTAVIVKILRGAIALLELAIVQLETQPPISIPPPSWRTPAIAAIALASFSLAYVLTSGKLTEIVEIPAIQLPSSKIADISQTETSPPQVTAPLTEEIPAEEKTSLELTLADSSVPVEISPPPISVPTPEQNLITTIQDRMAKIATEFTGSVIRSLKVDFFRSLLVVNLSNSWYNLSPERQNQLANAILQGAKELDFTRLELKDPYGILLARSPILGSQMIVVKRQAPEFKDLKQFLSHSASVKTAESDQL